MLKLSTPVPISSSAKIFNERFSAYQDSEAYARHLFNHLEFVLEQGGIHPNYAKTKPDWGEPDAPAPWWAFTLDFSMDLPWDGDGRGKVKEAFLALPGQKQLRTRFVKMFGSDLTDYFWELFTWKDENREK